MQGNALEGRNSVGSSGTRQGVALHGVIAGMMPPSSKGYHGNGKQEALRVGHQGEKRRIPVYGQGIPPVGALSVDRGHPDQEGKIPDGKSRGLSGVDGRF